MAGACLPHGGWPQPKDILYGELASGRRSKGRPQLRFKDVCKRDMKALDINTKSWEDLAAGHMRWRSALNLHLKSGKEKLVNAEVGKRRIEPYLLVCTKPEHRKALCRLRISAHDLQIERGRYANIAREDRKCRTCGVVEDELHFLNDCTRYDLLSQKLLEYPNVRDLCSDGTTNNNFRPSDFLQLDKAQMHLAEYVYNCMSLRI